MNFLVLFSRYLYFPAYLAVSSLDGMPGGMEAHSAGSLSLLCEAVAFTEKGRISEKEMEGNRESGYERATTADVTSSESPPFLCSLRSSSHFNNLKAKIFAFFQENATQ